MSDAARTSGMGVLSAGTRTPWFLTTAPESTNTIPRPDVVSALERTVRAHPVTVVGAPSGYGKSTAVAEWARGTALPVAWLTLTRFDGDSERIAHGVVAAVRRTVSDPAVHAQLEAAVVDALGDELVVVVDQLEFAVDPGNSLLGALAAKTPRGLRMVLISTSPPRDVLRTLRLRTDAGALDAAALAFAPGEIVTAAAALAERTLSPADADLIRERTGGWPVAVRFSLGGAELSADLDEYVEDAILAPLAPELVSVIRATAVTSVLGDDLAVSLSGRPDAAALLDECVRRGLFLDRFSRDGRRAYVWHSAFREAVLTSEARRDALAVVTGHLRAAEAQRASAPLIAVEHYLAAGRPEEAYATLLDRWLELLQEGRSGALDRACASLPGAFAERRATLAIRACCAWTDHDLAGGRRLIARAADDADATPQEATVIALAMLLTSDDPDVIRDRSHVVDEAIGRTDVVSASALPYVLFVLGYAAMRVRRGPVDAVPTLRTALREAEARGRSRLASRVAASLAWALAFAGRFGESLVLLEPDHQGEPDDEWRVYDGGGRACTIGFIKYWQNDLVAARAAFEEVRRGAHGPTAFEPVALMYDALAASASGDRVWQAEALDRLHGMPAETILGVPWQGFRDCALAELALVHGRDDDARRYADRSAQSTDFLPVPRAMACETFRRIGDAAAARAVIARTDAAGLTLPARVRLVLTDALLRDAAARDDAHVAVERALDLAAPERILRPFADPLPELRDLLERHATWGTRHGAFIAEALNSPGAPHGADLSEREREILAYLRTPLTIAEIAAALFLSVNTVKTHVQSIYRKLGVGSRRDAVRVRL
jgi:LuxR family maltose regulon positive regulatory protein